MSLQLDNNSHEQDVTDLLTGISDKLTQMIELHDDPLPVQIQSNSGQSISINKAGEISAINGNYDLAVFNELDVINTAYNFYPPDGSKQFIMTGFLIYGDKQVSAVTNATVVIYEATSSDTVTESRVLIQVEVGQNQSIPFPNIKILANSGKYINAKTSDDDIHMTIFGYYIQNGKTTNSIV